jgi:hypothetical protein
MTLEEQERQESSQKQQQLDWGALTTEQKSRMLCSHVESDQGSRCYFSIHTKVRSIIYVQKYIADNLNRAEVLNIIRESYFPMLLKEFVKWERNNGRKMSKADIELFKHPAVKHTTSELLFYWLEEKAKTLRQEHRESRFRRMFGY